MKFAYIVAMSMLVAAPLSAQIVFDDNAQPVAAQPTKAKSEVGKVVCRSQEEIGSRLRQHKVCMTVEQWQQYQRDYKDQVQEIQSLSSVRHSG
jgi:hypothetical protein